MAVSKLRARVQKFAMVLMGLVSVYLVYYTYHSFRRAIRFCFSEPDRWTNLRIVDADAVIATGTRYTYFGLWTAAIVFSMAGIIAGLYLLNRVRIGFFFDEVSSRSIQIFGAITVVAMVVDTIFGAFDLYLLTLHNAEDRYPIQYLYDPSDLKTALLASVMFVFGWVMREAVLIERENKGYV
jgi:hypothetical protein